VTDVLDPDGEEWDPELDDPGKIQKELLKFGRDQLKYLKGQMAEEAARRTAMSSVHAHGYANAPVGYVTARPTAVIRMIENGWIVSYWAGREVELYAKTDELASIVASAAMVLVEFEKNKPKPMDLMA
jgi:hypothetical protein